jgi:hypothetical protein
LFGRYVLLFGGGVKNFIKRGLRLGYRAIKVCPWLLIAIKKCLLRFPKLEAIVRRGLSTGSLNDKNHDEALLTDLELKALMDIRDAIAAARE